MVHMPIQIPLDEGGAHEDHARAHSRQPMNMNMDMTNPGSSLMRSHGRALVALTLFLALGNVIAAAIPEGQLVIDPEHPQWIMRHAQQHVFLSGPGDPEGFLYRGTRREDGTREGDQESLIAKLAQHGGNCIYMQVVRSHGGDGRPDHNPFADSDPASGLDAEILAQWERWFSQMEGKGIVIYLFLYDDASRIWDTGDEVGPAERRFIQEMVGAFRHHRNLIWIVAEESEEAYSMERVQRIAGLIREADVPGRIIGNHHHSGTTFKAWRQDGALNHFAMQCNVPNAEVHAHALEAWRKAKGRYHVIYSENTESEGADIESLRDYLWASAMAGLMPMRLGIDIANTPPETLRLFRIQERFFIGTPFYRMSPHDELAGEGARWVLADPGHDYIVLAQPEAWFVQVQGLPAGTYRLKWVDCVSGNNLIQNGVVIQAGAHALNKPPLLGDHWAVALQRVEPGR